MNAAIILGAGNGSRMRSETSKLLLEIGGKTVIERSVDAFLATALFGKIIVVCRECDLNDFKSILAEKPAVSFVIGGQSRQESVANAVMAIGNEKVDYIAVHDGARPLVQPLVINTTFFAAQCTGAAACGVKPKDTMKRTDANNIIVETLEREQLYAIQTPQIFDYELYKTALKQAQADGVDLTDDCQLIERIGKKVAVVDSDYGNIKITTSEDIPLATQILQQRGALK